jgi:hypothetical protein
MNLRGLFVTAPHSTGELKLDEGLERRSMLTLHG